MMRTSRTIPPYRPARHFVRPEFERLEGRALLATAAAGPLQVTPAAEGGSIVPPPALPAGVTVQGTGSDGSATALSGTDFAPLVSFTVPGSVLDSGPFQVAIAWGDGSTGQASPEVPASGGLTIDSYGPIYAADGADPETDYTIAFDAPHVYGQAGTYTYTATFFVGADPTALATATGTITVAPADTSVPPVTGTAPDVTATAGLPIALTASFAGPGSSFGVGSYAESTVYGDGSTDGVFTGFDIEGQGGQSTVSFTVAHAYQSPGTYTYQVTFLYDGAVVGTATGTVTVVAPDPSSPVVTASAPPVTATAGVPADLTATLAGPTSVIGLGSFAESTDYGDGSTGDAVDGFTWQDQGDQVTYTTTVPHTYQAPGTYTYQVTFVVDGVDVATASGTVTVVAPPAGGPGSSGTGQGGSTGNVAAPVLVPAVAVSSPLAYGPQAQAVVPASPALTTSAPVPAPAAVAGTNPLLLAGPAYPIVTGGGVPSGPDLEGLWAGLYTAPGAATGSSVAAPSLAGAPSTPSNPLLFDVTYWDPALRLLTT